MLSIEEAVAKYDGKTINTSVNTMIEDLGEHYTAHLTAVRDGRIINVNAIITDSVADQFRQLWIESEGDGYDITYIDKYAPTEYIRRNLQRYGWTDVDDDDGHFGYGHTTEPGMARGFEFAITNVLLTPEFLVSYTKEVKERMEAFYTSKGIDIPWKKSE